MWPVKRKASRMRTHPQLGNTDAMAADLELIVTDGKPVINPLAPKRRVTCALGKEILERTSQLHDRHLGCTRS